MGSKTSKYHRRTGERLSQETINELCSDTGFTEEELLNWHTNFYKDCPDGRLTLKQFEHEYAKIMGRPTQKTADYIRHMFNVYDQDKNQFIDFKEFVTALSAASVVNRLRLVETIFHVFDLDNDGKITKDEIAKMLHTLVDVTNSNNKHRRHHHNHQKQQQQTKQIDLQKRIDDAFNELNTNDDDHITKDEFIEWYMKSGLISDVQSNEIDVANPSRIQEIGKKSRKLMKQASHMKTNHESDDHHRVSQLVRHISRMTEKKSESVNDNDDVYDQKKVSNNHLMTPSFSEVHDANDQMTTDQLIHRGQSMATITSGDTESQSSKENDRWQHLFNSVLGQIRAQRVKNPQTEQNNFHSWKHEGEERLKSEYMRQKSTQPENHSHSPNKTSTTTVTTLTSYSSPPSPDIITVRL